MLRKFASLKEPTKYGYAFDSDVYDGKAFFADGFRQFETYGDQLCQHSRDWPVQVEFMADYMASLATAMLNDPELTKVAGWKFRYAPSITDIEFAASVVFKPAKNADGADLPYEKGHGRYYSMQERKISAVAEKRYDKRYQPVEAWCNGSVDAIYRMLVSEYAKGMEFYSIADGIRDWCLDERSKGSKPPYFYGGLTAQYLKWFEGDHRKALDFRYAWNACKELFKALEAREQAECNLGNLHWPEEKAVENTEAA
jgi:hypothetical protein